jgi:hypothetical protein
VSKETGIDIAETCFFMRQRLSGTRKRVTWSASGGWQSNWRGSICTAAVLNVANSPWPTRRQLLDSIPSASPNRALPGGRVDTPTSCPLASPHGSVAAGPWGIRSKCAYASTPTRNRNAVMGSLYNRCVARSTKSLCRHAARSLGTRRQVEHLFADSRPPIQPRRGVMTALPVFSRHILQHHPIQRQFRHQFLQSAILVLQLLQLTNFVDLQSGELLFQR